MSRARAIFLFLAGAMMVTASFAHALAGWPALKPELEKLSASKDVMDTASIGWHWGSATMATLGVIVLAGAWRWWSGDRSGAFAVRLVAACWILFGIATMLTYGVSGHFTGFIVIGALALAPTLGDGS
ncbi:MAG: hypothetical protein ACREAA_11055 [Candidatus Polarisedimenticolia bacterium]